MMPTPPNNNSAITNLIIGKTALAFCTSKIFFDAICLFDPAGWFALGLGCHVRRRRQPNPTRKWCRRIIWSEYRNLSILRRMALGMLNQMKGKKTALQTRCHGQGQSRREVDF